MDSHFFRCLGREMAREIRGSRLEKIYSPAPSVHTLELRGAHSNRFLLFHSDKNSGYFFLSEEKPRNPGSPDSRTMWFRKHLSGRRLLEPRLDWARRRMAWLLSPRSGELESWLLFDVQNGLQLVSELPADFDADPQWPTLRAILDDGEIWRSCPHISPLLRKSLNILAESDPEQAETLYKRLVVGACPEFFLYAASEGEPLVTTWKLPDLLHNGRHEQTFQNALDAAKAAGSQGVFTAPDSGAVAEDTARRKTQRKKLERVLKKLDQDEERLHRLRAAREQAKLMQANLYTLDPSEKCASLSLVDYSSGEGVTVEISLDPRYSIRENMERLFHQAGKGDRGLERINARRSEINAELQALAAGTPLADTVAPQLISAKKKTAERRKGISKKELALHEFRSSDGFQILRGKNSTANHKLLSQKASPFDYWFHAQDGPGAHCILKRDHPNQEVPDRSLEEAAALAGLKSWQSQDGKARVLCCLVRDVRHFKGAAMGQVLVDKVLRVLQVRLDPDLEARLRHP